MAFKGTIPWNKGLTKESDGRVHKYPESRRKKISEKSKLAWIKTRKERLGDDYWLFEHPEEWKIICTTCDENIKTYKRFNGFYKSFKNKQLGLSVECNSCKNTGIKFSEETKLKQSIAAKNRNIDPINESIRKQKIKQAQQERYKNMSAQDLKSLREQQQMGYVNMDPERKRRHYERVKECNIQRILRSGPLDRFMPAYNISTIQLIENDLNKKYNTKFMHAENGGEFKIYDKENKRFYYADAYCPKLNLWIEFDEQKKFKYGKLPEDQLIREDRIKILINCDIVRIKVD